MNSPELPELTALSTAQIRSDDTLHNGPWVAFEDAATALDEMQVQKDTLGKRVDDAEAELAAAERRAIEAEGDRQRWYEAARQLAVQLSPVKTARTEQNLNIAHEMAERLKVELRNACPAPVEGEAQEQVLVTLSRKGAIGLVADIDDPATDEARDALRRSLVEHTGDASFLATRSRCPSCGSGDVPEPPCTDRPDPWHCLHSTTKDPEEGDDDGN